MMGFGEAGCIKPGVLSDVKQTSIHIAKDNSVAEPCTINTGLFFDDREKNLYLQYLVCRFLKFI